MQSSIASDLCLRAPPPRKLAERWRENGVGLAELARPVLAETAQGNLMVGQLAEGR
jgi:hypothetical protein